MPIGTIFNGMSLSKLRPFGATFFIFSDYARAPNCLPVATSTSKTSRNRKIKNV